MPRASILTVTSLAALAALAIVAHPAQAQQRMASGVQLTAYTTPTPSAANGHVLLAPTALGVRTAGDAATEANPAVPAKAASGFAKSGFAQFMASPAGRVLRVVAGAGMIAGGISMDSNGGNALAVVGAVPLSAGLFDICWLSPIFGGPLKGKDIRAAK